MIVKFITVKGQDNIANAPFLPACGCVGIGFSRVYSVS